jgi:Protein of unknown function (DUF1214)
VCCLHCCAHGRLVARHRYGRPKNPAPPTKTLPAAAWKAAPWKLPYDVYFGPKAPEGKEPNWVPSSTSNKFEVLFRLYGPEEPLFDKIWMLPDIERLPTVHTAQVQLPSSALDAVPVTPDNFVRAESDLYFGNAVKDSGGVGKFFHHREPTSSKNSPSFE